MKIQEGGTGKYEGPQGQRRGSITSRHAGKSVTELYYHTFFGFAAVLLPILHPNTKKARIFTSSEIKKVW